MQVALKLTFVTIISYKGTHIAFTFIPFHDVLVKNDIYFVRKAIHFLTNNFFFVMNEIDFLTNEIQFVTYEINVFTNEKYFVRSEFYLSI